MKHIQRLKDNGGMKQIVQDMAYIRSLYEKLLQILPSFNITDKKILPYGLKPHTRSISWIVEQVITQQTKFRKKELGLDTVNFDLPDTCLHDCEITTKDKTYYVNIKISNADSTKENKNDISAVEKLYMFYTAHPTYDLIYACFGVKFRGINIQFDRDYLTLFSPQFLPIYVNPRNDKIQAYYKHEPIYRTREEFLKLLVESSKSINLKK